MKTLDGVPEATMKELEAVTDGIFGLMTCIPRAADQLGLDMRQVGIFCRNTPNGAKGEALWREFTSRRDSPKTPGYGFTHFMRDVLAEAGHPIA